MAFCSGSEIHYTRWAGQEQRSRDPRRQAAMIINLNQYRKKRGRGEAERRAVENRVRYGRSKEARTKDLRENARARKDIEDKRLD